MDEYFYGRFPQQLATFAFHRPNPVVREQIMHDPGVVFFGDADWEGVRDDLGRIPPEDHSKFVLSLFMIVLTDQALYTYFADSYRTWRAKTRYPKFGWSGFGPHKENPFKILWAPERDGVIEVEETLAMLPEFAAFLTNQTADYFGRELPGVDVAAYFQAIRGDAAYQLSNGVLIPHFRECFEQAIENA